MTAELDEREAGRRQSPTWDDVSKGFRHRIDDGTLLAALAFLIFLGLWGSVLIGHRVLLGGDILESFPPWLGNPPPAPRNPLLADPVTQFYPWLAQIRDSLGHWRLPLWTDGSFSGAPLLANQQSATFSPFTLLALLFDPARGYSLAMLAKLWVAGAGMFVFLRLLGARGLAAVAGGVAYATCSFMIVWLAHPHTAVMAILVWGFAAVEWYLRNPRLRALAAVALAVALQFLAGHAETSLHLGLALGAYALARAVARPDRRIAAIGGLVVAGGLGALVAGIQLVPFLSELRASTLYQERLNSGAGFAHLQISELASWVVPNGHGNPSVDGQLGRTPNYNESTGFAGITMLLLAPAGAWWLWRRARSAAAALCGITLVGAGIVYGALSPLSGRLPLLSTANGARSIVVVCFGVTALGGLGLEAVLAMRPRWCLPTLSRLGIASGAAALLGLGVAGLELFLNRRGVDGLLGSWHGNIGFWVAVSMVTVVGVVGFLAAAVLGAQRVAGFGLAILTVAEATIFAGPFQPRVPPGEVPPPSASLVWLQANSGDSAVAGSGLSLIPNLSSLYGLHDVRGYDLFLNPRMRTYWQHADAGYHDEAFYTLLTNPGVPWLAAAGVRYFVTPPGGALAGTIPVFSDGTAEISEVPGARPFAFSTVTALPSPDEATAIRSVSADPLGRVPIEASGLPSGGSAATVQVLRREAGAVDLEVDGSSASSVVVLQAWDADWTATVDDITVPVQPADVEFQAVSVQAGRHIVHLRYAPHSVVIGAALSLVGLLGIAVLLAAPFVVSRVRRRARGRL